LIDIWKSENKLSEFINYNALEESREFGGIRIEEDFVITESGAELLGPPIPKNVTDVEQVRNTTVH
jgi:Xaa-Pro aminopeptidase